MRIVSHGAWSGVAKESTRVLRVCFQCLSCGGLVDMVRVERDLRSGAGRALVPCRCGRRLVADLDIQNRYGQHPRDGTSFWIGWEIRFVLLQDAPTRLSLLELTG